MRRLTLLTMVLICSVVQAKDIRIAVDLFIDDELSESRVTRLFRDYLETIDDLDLFVGTDPSIFAADPETDVFIYITVLEVNGSHVVVVFPSDRMLVNNFLVDAYLPDDAAMLRRSWTMGGASFASNPSLETAIGWPVDHIDDFLDREVRPFANLY